MKAGVCNSVVAIVTLLAAGAATAAEPRVPKGYEFELVAQEPDIVTPIAMAFDAKGRLLVVESHTHQRPQAYEGPKGDRIRMFSDSNGDGKLDRWSTFADGFKFAVGLLPRPDGAVYVITRQSIELVRDTNDDGTADERRQLIRMETEDEYPHNGLEGLALAPDGSLFFGLGENHGMSFTLVGSDGSKFSGKGGVDGIFRATADGGQLEHYARGCWNPFSICFDPEGRLFAADNDPDSSPPCRLLHIVPGGDYGFLFQYGRAGTHPLQAWNGELPGTLPMICGIGEAPTALVPHAGRLWVTSWGDHRLEAYRLIPKGASFTAEREVVVQGDTEFRPTGLAVAPDGSLYLGDWMLRDYEVHGRGRIWRLTLPKDELARKFPPRSAAEVAAPPAGKPNFELNNSPDPFVRAQGVQQLAEHNPADPVIAVTPAVRLALLQSQRLRDSKDTAGIESLLREGLKDESPEVRLYAVRWIADERMTSLRGYVAELLNGPLPSSRYYLAVLGAVDWLDKEFDAATTRGVSETLLVRELQNSERSPEVHALALRLLPPDNKLLTLDFLRQLLEQKDATLRLEAVRTLSQQTNPKRFELLASIADDEDYSEDARAVAIAGLAAAAQDYHDELDEFAAGDNETLAAEARRVLRLTRLVTAPADFRPAPDDLAAWNSMLAEAGDAKSGRRLFFSAVGARCAVCHQYDGRGGTVGPDLSNISDSNSRDRIIASILQPSQEIAPHYQSWILVTKDGQTRSGLRLAKAGDDGVEPYVDSEGNTFTLRSDEIDVREPSPVSIMPDGLEQLLSIEDLRDLVTFLSGEGTAGTK
jgi:putative membrane-bound dehydrogenase-like protein